jgi:hypothetical protein
MNANEKIKNLLYALLGAFVAKFLNNTALKGKSANSGEKIAVLSISTASVFLLPTNLKSYSAFFEGLAATYIWDFIAANIAEKSRKEGAEPTGFLAKVLLPQQMNIAELYVAENNILTIADLQDITTLESETEQEFMSVNESLYLAEKSNLTMF